VGFDPQPVDFQRVLRLAGSFRLVDTRILLFSTVRSSPPQRAATWTIRQASMTASAWLRVRFSTYEKRIAFSKT
jgi:hypothetical protein